MSRSIAALLSLALLSLTAAAAPPETRFSPEIAHFAELDKA